MRDEDEEVEPASATVVADQGAPSRIFTWKNAIVGGIGAFALWGVVAAGWLLFAQTGNETIPALSERSIDPSIAVLPFRDVGPEGDQDYVAEGFADHIQNTLTRIQGLKVTARTSSFLFGDSDLDVRTIADSLGVATVLDGTVHRSGDQVVITVQLVEGETAFNLWSESYEGVLTNILEVQQEVARQVAERLQVELGGPEGRRLAGAETMSTEALDHYLRGRQLVEQRSRSGTEGAIAAFRASMEADPSYSPAYAGLAEAYQVGVIYGFAPPDSIYAWAGQVLAYADRAVELDSHNAEAYGVRAWGGLHPPLRITDVGRDLERALDIRPGSSDLLSWYAQWLTGEGRHSQALDLHEQVIELDPLAPGRRIGYAYSALGAGENELALQQVRRLREIQPRVGEFGTGWEVFSLLFLGRSEECLDLDESMRAHEAMCLHDVGRVGEAEAIADSLSAAWTTDALIWIADGLSAYYAWTGDGDRAVEWVERALSTSPNVQSVSLLDTHLWDSVLEADHGRVRSTVMQLVREAWERQRAHSRSVELP